MRVSVKIKNRIKQLPEGTTFDYQTLSIEREEYIAATKVLERLIRDEVIKRISSGIFYKPKQTVFGSLKPNEEELLKTYLFENGKRIAYITGISLYNRMGLTRQVPNTIKIACRDRRIFASLGLVKGKAVKSYVDVTDDNYQLLELLDALKDFNQIPDIDPKSGIDILIGKIQKLNPERIDQITTIALKYPPRVRALLGSMLELFMPKTYLTLLKESLNPLSKYKFEIHASVLPNAQNWCLQLGEMK